MSASSQIGNKISNPHDSGRLRLRLSAEKLDLSNVKIKSALNELKTELNTSKIKNLAGTQPKKIAKPNVTAANNKMANRNTGLVNTSQKNNKLSYDELFQKYQEQSKKIEELIRRMEKFNQDKTTKIQEDEVMEIPTKNRFDVINPHEGIKAENNKRKQIDLSPPPSKKKQTKETINPHQPQKQPMQKGPTTPTPSTSQSMQQPAELQSNAGTNSVKPPPIILINGQPSKAIEVLKKTLNTGWDAAINCVQARSDNVQVWTAGAGAKYKINSRSTVRFKFNTDLQLGTSLQQKLDESVTLTSSCNIDCTNVSRGDHKVGLALGIEA